AAFLRLRRRSRGGGGLSFSRRPDPRNPRLAGLVRTGHGRRRGALSLLSLQPLPSRIARGGPAHRRRRRDRAANHGPPRGTGGDGALAGHAGGEADRKSTRLNSSHVKISYAVFCLKKKKKLDNLVNISHISG